MKAPLPVLLLAATALPACARANPLGVYVHAINWSRETAS